jgi:surface antigen
VRWRSIALLAGGLAVLSSLPATARVANGGNCVAFARDLTGVRLDGNAAAWWPHAEGRYERGHQPSVGAILVFKPYARMHVGHVAVVSRVIGPREVLVDQANWVRGRVTKAMSVVDASPLNDWTSVKVLEPHSGTHGRENPTFGFIYPGVLPASFGETIVEPQQPDRHRGSRAAHSAEPRSHDEVITEAPARDHSHAVSVVRSAHAADHRVPAKAHEADAGAAHHKATGGTAKVQLAPSDAATPEHRVAADAPAHHGHKVKDAKFAGVY